jgi:hypothetical protein
MNLAGQQSCAAVARRAPAGSLQGRMTDAGAIRDIKGERVLREFPKPDSMGSRSSRETKGPTLAAAVAALRSWTADQPLITR